MAALFDAFRLFCRNRGSAAPRHLNGLRRFFLSGHIGGDGEQLLSRVWQKRALCQQGQSAQNGGNGAGDTRHTTAANAPNDLNFVMLADSYRVMQLSYLEKDFTDCFLTHRNRVNDADVKEAIKNSDILVIAAVERLETNILDTAKQIINILEEDAK